MAIVALGLMCLVLSGCTNTPSEPPLQPKVAPPSIQKGGTLRAAVDLSNPPFAGVDNGKQAGIDVDVAAALAEQLGLKLELVDVKASGIATALADKSADVALSAPYTSELLSRAAIAGTYLTDGPALFAARTASSSIEPSGAPDALVAAKVGAQLDSESYWQLLVLLGNDRVTTYPTLRAALEAVRKGEIQYAGGDAFVGAYIARDIPEVAYAGQITGAHPLGVAVATDNTRLADSVRVALDQLAADGVLEAIRTKWVGSLPRLAVPGSAEETAQIESTKTVP
jgi:polar amino acid transport system substrate-binding protein